MRYEVKNYRGIYSCRLVYITPRPPAVLASEGSMGAHCSPPILLLLRLHMSRTLYFVRSLSPHTH